MESYAGAQLFRALILGGARYGAIYSIESVFTLQHDETSVGADEQDSADGSALPATQDSTRP
jgi:hypothetical protein